MHKSRKVLFWENSTVFSFFNETCCIAYVWWLRIDPAFCKKFALLKIQNFAGFCVTYTLELQEVKGFCCLWIMRPVAWPKISVFLSYVVSSISQVFWVDLWTFQKKIFFEKSISNFFNFFDPFANIHVFSYRICVIVWRKCAGKMFNKLSLL